MKTWRRFQYTSPWKRGYWWALYAGHGGDEYGNCSLYLGLPLLGFFVIFHDRHYQTDVELPEPGECAWVDRRYYQEKLPPGIKAVIEEGRRHPERDRPRPRRDDGKHADWGYR